MAVPTIVKPSSYTMEARGAHADQEQGLPAISSEAAASQRSVSAVFVKTRKCRFFGMGICTKGDACNYAHNRDELRPVPDFFRTKLCPIVTRGDVCNDALCKFAHTKEEKRKLSGPSRHTQAEVMQAAVVDGNVVEGLVETRWLQQTLEELARPEASALQAMVPTTATENASNCESRGDAKKRLRPRGCRAGKRRSSGKSAEISDDPAGAPHSVTDSTSVTLATCTRAWKSAPPAGSVFEVQSLCEIKIKDKKNLCDLKFQKDLRCTIVCPTLICTGDCNKPGCAYAHSISDLRNAYNNQQALITKLGLPGVADSMSLCRQITPSTDADGSDYQDASDFEEASTCTSGGEYSMDSDFSDSLCSSPPPEFDSPCTSLPCEHFGDDEILDAVLMVQNTFVTLEPLQPPLERRLRRVQSAPGGLDNLMMEGPSSE